MPRLTPGLARSRARLGADRRPRDRSRIQTVPLASLPLAQRRLISALLGAAKAAAVGRAVAAEDKGSESQLRQGAAALPEGVAGADRGPTPSPLASALRPASRKAQTPAEHAARTPRARSLAARATRQRRSRRG
jgi:hypothetical protein